MKKTIIVFGAGHRLGNHVAEIFGINNFRAVLMSRSEQSSNMHTERKDWEIRYE